MKTQDSSIGLIYVPWRIITTKAIISDENGTRSYWQINRWERFKLFIFVLSDKIFHKTTKIK
jgi:hypothetical protein